MSEKNSYTHVTEQERSLPTHRLLELLREAMTAKPANGRSLEAEATSIEQQEQWMSEAAQHETQVLENYSNNVFSFFAELLKKKQSVKFSFTEISSDANDTKDHSIKIMRDAGGLRCIFSFEGRNIDLIFYKDASEKIYIKQHLGGTKGTRRLPEGAEPYKNNFDFAGSNIIYLRDELEALSGVLDMVDDFNSDITFAY